MSKWALITGASSGIGYAYAEEMASRGYSLVIVSNEEEAIQERGNALSRKYGIEAKPLYRDLAVPGAARELYDTCCKENIEIEVLINNAGMFFFEEMVEVREEVVEKMLYLHVITPTMLCRLFAKDMKARRHGYILNMSSMSAWIPYPGIGEYASTKAYLKAFSRALRSELADYGVGVTVLCPGAVATNLYNLSDDLKALAIRLGIMMRPEKLVRKGVDAMFRKKYLLMPGLLNKVFMPVVVLVPHNLVRWLMRKSNLLPKKN